MADAVLEKLNLTPEEVGRLSKAMKDPKFMELLDEYAKEISEPASKEEAEGYIKMMEERSNFSMDGKELIIPQVDFCAKTKNKISNGKVFINICHSDKVAKPTPTPRSDQSGVQWEIPYSLAPTRRDKDKAGNDCEVHDFVVNTETHTRAEESLRFKNFLVETAMDAIEKQRGVKLDRDFTLPKLSYKGPNKVPKLLTVSKDKLAASKDTKDRAAVSKDKVAPTREKAGAKDPTGAKKKKPDMEKPSVPSRSSRSKVSSAAPSAASSARGGDSSKRSSNASPEMDNVSEASYLASTSEASGSHNCQEGNVGSGDDAIDATYCTSLLSGKESGPVEPPYELIYRNKVDYGDFWTDNTRLVKGQPSGPEEILLRVFLPEVKSADDIELDVCDRDIILKVLDKYFLKVGLSYAVDESQSVAKFDKNKMKLEVTLPTCISATQSDIGSVMSSCKDSSESNDMSEKNYEEAVDQDPK